MQLYYFLFVIISLSCGSLPPVAAHDPAAAFLASLAMVGAWCVLCHISAPLIAHHVRDEQLSPLLGARLIEKQLEALRWLSLPVILLCLAGFGLSPVLDTIPVLAESMFLQAIVLLAPGLIILVASWTAEHRYGVMLNYCDQGIAGYIDSVVTTFRGGLAWLIVPVLALLGLIDMIGILPIPSDIAGVIAICLAVIVIPVTLPTMVQHLFRTSPIEDKTNQWIGRVLSAGGVGEMKAVRWETDGSAFNAVVAGFVRPFRVLLVSDRLLDELPRDQLAMVLLHEAAHIRRHHVPLRMLAVLPAWVIATIVTKLLGDVSWAMPIGTAVGIAITMLILRWVAYRTEFDADAQACKLAVQIHGRCSEIPDNYVRAREELSKALLRVTAENPESRRATWLHPGVADRLNWMRRQRPTPSSSTSNAGTIANPA